MFMNAAVRRPVPAVAFSGVAAGNPVRIAGINASLSAKVWDKNWRYIAKQNIAPDVSDSTPGSPGRWLSGIVRYIKANNLSWTYRAINGAVCR
jgi:hypothetical protein